MGKRGFILKKEAKRFLFVFCAIVPKNGAENCAKSILMCKNQKNNFKFKQNRLHNDRFYVRIGT